MGSPSCDPTPQAPCEARLPAQWPAPCALPGTPTSTASHCSAEMWWNMVKGTWWNMVKHGETWWNMVKHGETWWNMVKHGETWWNMVKHGEHGETSLTWAKWANFARIWGVGQKLARFEDQRAQSLGVSWVGFVLIEAHASDHHFPMQIATYTNLQKKKKQHIICGSPHFRANLPHQNSAPTKLGKWPYFTWPEIRRLPKSYPSNPAKIRAKNSPVPWQIPSRLSAVPAALWQCLSAEVSEGPHRLPWPGPKGRKGQRDSYLTSYFDIFHIIFHILSV